MYDNLLKDYEKFLKDLDSKLSHYFNIYSCYICCKKGCSQCCEKGDYPISELELRYIMQGYINLDIDKKHLVQNNIKSLTKGSTCPFLIDNICAIYKYRPIICRVHGLAYIGNNNIVKTPYCANNGLNYSEVFNNHEFFIEPIKENLDTNVILKEFDFGEIRYLYDWINKF